MEQQKRLIEQRMCRMWLQAEQTGDWWEANIKLHEIAMVMNIAGHADTAADFAFCADIALARAVYAVKDREARAAA